MIRNTLKALFGDELEGDIFTLAGIKGTERAEALTVTEWIELANVLSGRAGGG